MLEALNNAGSIAQPFGLWQESEKHPPQKTSHPCEHGIMWWSCLIITSATNKNAVDMVLVNWKWPELANNEPK